MCRLFAFKSITQSNVRQSLLDAENALKNQSFRHPDGWGVVYYVAGAPHLIKSEKTAIKDTLYNKISGIVSSSTVLAHLRKATKGSINILNTHPFQYGNWVFAHNGNIKNFDKHRADIKKKIAPALHNFILGTTDSELIFFLILTHISKRIPLNRPDCDAKLLYKCAAEAIEELINIIGPFSTVDKGPDETYITFIITNGATVLAHQGGKQLFYSTYKPDCTKKAECPHYCTSCEMPTKTGEINHIIFASEPPSDANAWIPMKNGQMIGTDWSMDLKIFQVEK